VCGSEGRREGSNVYTANRPSEQAASRGRSWQQRDSCGVSLAHKLVKRGVTRSCDPSCHICLIVHIYGLQRKAVSVIRGGKIKTDLFRRMSQPGSLPLGLELKVYVADGVWITMDGAAASTDCQARSSCVSCERACCTCAPLLQSVPAPATLCTARPLIQPTAPLRYVLSGALCFYAGSRREDRGAEAVPDPRPRLPGCVRLAVKRRLLQLMCKHYHGPTAPPLTKPAGREVLLLATPDGSEGVSTLPDRLPPDHGGVEVAGTVVFSRMVTYTSFEQFAADERLHRVPATGTPYGWVPGVTEVLYGWVVERAAGPPDNDQSGGPPQQRRQMRRVLSSWYEAVA
jgi:hypothetical protein